MSQLLIKRSGGLAGTSRSGAHPIKLDVLPNQQSILDKLRATHQPKQAQRDRFSLECIITDDSGKHLEVIKLSEQDDPQLAKQLWELANS